MQIIKNDQLNHGVSKYKVLSSNSGVGSIVSTKWGGFVMPLSSSDWDFVKIVSEDIKEDIKKHNRYEIDFDSLSKKRGVEFVEDGRFVKFLNETENLVNLRCLVAIPHIQLTQFNRCDVKNHPLNIRYKETHPEANENSDLNTEMFTIPAIVFPRWFYSKKKLKFKPVEEWLEIWKNKRCNNGLEDFFAPPRDPYSPTSMEIKDNRLTERDDKKIYELLEQVSMALICPNGHISDIPWYKYFCARYNHEQRKEPELYKEGFDLFAYDESSCDCPGHEQHELQWIENRNHAESYGVLKCINCNKMVSLEGIMNLQPHCPGHRPWEGKDHEPCNCSMKWALVTSNSVYYAETFSSLFIPQCYLWDTNILNDRQKDILKLMKENWYKKHKNTYPNATERDYVDSENVDSFIEKTSICGKELSREEMEQVIANFIPKEQQPKENRDIHDIREDYRAQEYLVFQTNNNSLPESDKLVFNDIVMPEELSGYFSKIQEVHTLALSCTQMNFSRVQMPQPRIIHGVIKYPDRMKIFKGKQEDVIAMPAIQTFGEGLFFSFKEETLNDWIEKNCEKFQKRFKRSKEEDESIYEDLKQEMERGGVAKFYLLHTFSHLLMKELEFSCGYPTASLCERLYYSDKMCGVLIYTADGSEGSMGGLVWQGQPNIIKEIIKSAMQRACNCSSDPICWENKDELNYAACFSCAMVSETSCEKRNMGLDRRILVDEDYGFFKGLI